MSRRRVALNLVATVYGRGLFTAVQLLTVPLLALHWGVHLYGCWVVMATMPGFLALADLGFGNAAFVRMTALVALDDRPGAVVVLHTARRIVFAASATVFALALAAIWAIPAGWLPRDAALPAPAARETLSLLAAYAVVIFQGQLQYASYASVGRFSLYTIAIGTTIALENALLALAVLAGYGPVAAAAGWLTGRVAGLVWLAWMLRRREPWLTPGMGRASVAERRALARAAASMAAIPLGQATALQGSLLALGAAAGAAATPAFAAARTLSRIGLQLTQLLTSALMPEFGAAHARDDVRGQAAMLLAVGGTATAAALPFALVIGLAGDRVMRWWTAGAVMPPAGLMPVMAAAAVLGGLWNPLSSMMIAIGRQAAFAWAYLVLGIASLLTTFLLSRSLGATGAAIGLVGLDACMAVLVGRFAWRHWLTGLPLRDVARGALARGRALAALRRGNEPDAGVV